jgi:hypothetical protein
LPGGVWRRDGLFEAYDGDAGQWASHEKSFRNSATTTNDDAVRSDVGI